MSVYSDWMKLSASYDELRPPNGVHLYLGLVYSLTGKNADEIHLLDAGCGTGNHVKYLVEKGLGKATLFDASRGMLEKARAKLKPYAERVTIEQNILPQIPYPDHSFDVVTFNQVLHHLVDQTDKEHKRVKETIKEAYRILKPNGLLIVTSCSHHQVKNAYWYTSLNIPESLRKHFIRLVDSDEFAAIFEEIGFQSNGSVVELTELLEPKTHYRIDGPLHDDWFKSNSFLDSILENERENMRDAIRKMQSDGSLEDFFKKADHTRKQIGQYTIFYALKARN